MLAVVAVETAVDVTIYKLQRINTESQHTPTHTNGKTHRRAALLLPESLGWKVRTRTTPLIGEDSLTVIVHSERRPTVYMMVRVGVKGIKGFWPKLE